MNKQLKNDGNSIINNIFLIIALITSLAYFVIALAGNIKTGLNIEATISLTLLTTFVIIFIFIGLSVGKKGATTTIIASLILIVLNSFNIASYYNLINLPSTNVEDFTNKSLAYVMKWANSNKISVKQVYEYSDMIEEYSVINQDIKDKSIKKINKLTVAISEGPNPSKEIVLPNMITWKSEDVIKYIKENNLSNIEIEFIVSQKLKDTVIEQDKTGNIKRNDPLKLIFSLGEENEITPTKLINLENKTEFEAVFWLKQHAIKFELNKDFSTNIKRGNVISQNKKINTVIKPNDEIVKLTISKGPKIKIPNFKKMTTVEITEWIIQNKLKVAFTDKYDESTKTNMVIDSNFKKGDIVEQRTLITIILSKGKLSMPKINSLNEFKEWASKYSVLFQEEYEFNSLISKGDVINYSHKEGDTIKNGDTIIIKISDGDKVSIPKLTGMKKQDIITKLKKININYNFVYTYNSTIQKDISTAQSMSEGSEVAEGSTITITLSNGKKPTTSGNNNTSNGSSSGGNTNNKPTPPPTCISKTYSISGELRNIFNNYSSYESVKNALYSYFSSNYPNVLLNVRGETETGMNPGNYVSGVRQGSIITSCNNVTYTIVIAK